MPRQRIIWFALGLLILSSLACNAFAGATEPSLTLPPPPVVETAVVPAPVTTVDLAPTATLPGAATDVPLVGADGNPLLAALVDVNIRTGPGTQYSRDGFLFTGETTQVVGRDPNSGWWKIECPDRSDGPECWISGGAQYTKVVNGEGVPVAAVPPTPEPTPTTTPTSVPADRPDIDTSLALNGLLAYTDAEGLWVVGLDTNAPLPVISAPRNIAPFPNIETPLIAPDGQKIAYLTHTDNANVLHMVTIDGRENHSLVSSVDLPISLEADTAVLIDRVQWLDDSQGLAFNTRIINLIGPGTMGRQDLWTVGLDGRAANERLTPGFGGATFDISPGNQVVFGQPTKIVRANLDIAGWDEVIEFDHIDTASEYTYSPQPHWTADGTQAYVAIPNASPWSEGANAALWRIPAVGEVELLTPLPGNILFTSVHWSPDGRQLAYVQSIVGPASPPPTLTLANGDGSHPTPYATGDALAVYGWNSAGSHFLYADSSFFAVGQAGTAAKETVITGATLDMQWISSTTFVAVSGVRNAWNIYSANTNGDSLLLAVSNDDFAEVAVWPGN